MPPDETSALRNILTSFDAQRLGDGSIDAGANVLAAMACAVANIQRPGSGLVDNEENILMAGSSLLVAGPLSSAIIRDLVITPLRDMQTNLLSHIREWDMEVRAIAANPRETHSNVHEIIPETRALSASKGMSLIPGDDANLLFMGFPNQLLRAMREQPHFLASAGSMQQLSQLIERSHLGRPLVVDSLRNLPHCAELARFCLPVIDGTMVNPANGKPVSGHLMLLDPAGVTNEAAASSSGQGRWLDRLPWLVDGGGAPPAPMEKSNTAKRLTRIEKRFIQTLMTGLSERFDPNRRNVATIPCETTAIQRLWTSFLADCEPDFPGITAVTRRLPATLVFGLVKISWGTLQIDTYEVLALAKHLARRMCHARRTLLQDSGTERRNHQKDRILSHLSSGPMSARDLGRKFHRLTTGECREMLDELRVSNRVVELAGDRWQLSLSEPLQGAPQTLTVDV